MLDDADFRPNPDRGIWIRGEMDKSLLERLRPQIIDLIARSREPITVFVDSTGGSPAVGDRILSLLRSRGQNGESACRIIAVALAKAESAAADFISLADFAIATPETRLLYHGTRLPRLDSVESRTAGLMANGLIALNQKHAVSLARKSVSRSISLVSTFLLSTFDDVRHENRNPLLSDLECLQEILRQKLSPTAQHVLEAAICRCGAYRGLLSCFRARMQRLRSSKRMDVEKAILRASVDFEFSRSGSWPNWSLRDGGIGRITQCFFFLDQFLGSGDTSSIIDGAHGQLYFELLPFCLALCGALQRGENALTATDAFWLGLVDTVRPETPALI